LTRTGLNNPRASRFPAFDKRVEVVHVDEHAAQRLAWPLTFSCSQRREFDDRNQSLQYVIAERPKRAAQDDSALAQVE
jgi:hypothetical protein